MYDKGINIREFIKFGCMNDLFDCKGYGAIKKVFLLILFAISMVCVFFIIIYTRKILNKRMNKELEVKVE